jgi:hypothetical protein
VCTDGICLDTREEWRHRSARAQAAWNTRLVEVFRVIPSDCELAVGGRYHSERRVWRRKRKAHTPNMWVRK